MFSADEVKADKSFSKNLVNARKVYRCNILRPKYPHGRLEALYPGISKTCFWLFFLLDPARHVTDGKAHLDRSPSPHLSLRWPFVSASFCINSLPLLFLQIRFRCLPVFERFESGDERFCWRPSRTISWLSLTWGNYGAKDRANQPSTAERERFGIDSNVGRWGMGNVHLGGLLKAEKVRLVNHQKQAATCNKLGWCEDPTSGSLERGSQ